MYLFNVTTKTNQVSINNMMMDRTYERMMDNYYASISDREIKDLIISQFAELFDLNQTDWYIPNQGYKAMRYNLLVKSVDIINKYITLFYKKNRNDRLEMFENNGTVATLKAMEVIFTTFNGKLLQSVPMKQYIPFIRFILENKPTLLSIMADRLRSYFYIQQNDKKELTYVTLTYLPFLSKQQLVKALPIIFNLFVDPSDNNPDGLFNKQYSQKTRDIINKNVTAWYGPLIEQANLPNYEEGGYKQQ